MTGPTRSTEMRSLEAQFQASVIEHGLVEEAELRRAVAESEQRGIPLDETLVALGFLTEDQAGTLKAELLSVAYVYPTASAVPRDLLAQFPSETLRRHVAVPLLEEENRVILATPNAASAAARRDLELACGREVGLSLASRGRVERLLAEMFPEDIAGKPPAREPTSVTLLYEHLARALDSGATEIRFEPSGGAIRVRYRIGGRLEDRGAEPGPLLFPLAGRIRALLGDRLRSRFSSQTGSFRTRIGDRDYRLEVVLLPTRFGESILIKLIAFQAPSGGGRSALDDASLAILDRAGKLTRGFILISSPDAAASRAAAYELLRRAGPDRRVVVTIEADALEPEPAFRQVETAGAPFGHVLVAALAYEPDVIHVGLPLEWPAEIAGALMAARTRLVVAATVDPSALEAVLRWFDSGAPTWLLAQVLGPMITLTPEGRVQASEPSEIFRRALERRAPPEELRASMGGG